MRENRLSGSEGGAEQPNAPSLPLSNSLTALAGAIMRIAALRHSGTQALSFCSNACLNPSPVR
jgi:hypothetical protein